MSDKKRKFLKFQACLEELGIIKTEEEAKELYKSAKQILRFSKRVTQGELWRMLNQLSDNKNYDKYEEVVGLIMEIKEKDG